MYSLRRRGSGHFGFQGFRWGGRFGQFWFGHSQDQVGHLLGLVVALPQLVQVQDLRGDLKDLAHVHRELGKPVFHVFLVDHGCHVDTGQRNEVGRVHQANVTPEGKHSEVRDNKKGFQTPDKRLTLYAL